ncbi:MAG: hypothetical protein ACXAC8_15940 [Candidatus Hodarchaeales archaeon]|jgi:hypothetical protein
MSNFDQFNHKLTTKSSTKIRVIKSQQQWLGDYYQQLQLVKSYNQLVKEIFVCHECGKGITNSRWVSFNHPEDSSDHSKIRFYHSRSKCNPHLNIICLYCGNPFRKKRKAQKYCSKKCAISVMNSPILIKHCLTCQMEFHTRVIHNTPNAETHCPTCR